MCLHLWVCFDTERPLFCMMKLDFEDDIPPTILTFKYEKLVDLSYICGHLDHIEIADELQSSSSGHGEWSSNPLGLRGVDEG